MKKNLLLLSFALVSIGLGAQNLHRLSISISGGSQKYRGDLGNGFTFKNNTWYGGGGFNVGYSINKSFEAGLFSFLGDYGYCQWGDDNTEVPVSERCDGCLGVVTLGNLNSRLLSGGVFVKYKLANGFLMKEESRLKPYIYLGAAMNKISDRMKMNCVNPGNYTSLNGGAGVKYYLNDHFNVGYNLGLGMLNNDHVDRLMKNGKDMYMQNTLTLGVDLF